MRIVFMGSSFVACRSLERLLVSPGIEVAAVVTQPDRPKGRRRKPAPSAVRGFVEGRDIPVLAPADVNDPEILAELRALGPALGVVVAFGQILGSDLLTLPPGGFVNVHASLLPKYRGAAPVQWALVNGETITGVSTIYMTERVDAGDIIFQDPVTVRPEETAGSLQERLAVAGADLLVRTVSAIAEGSARRTVQDESEVTQAPKLTKQDGRIDWTLPAGQIYNRVRGFNPWPCCFTELSAGGGRLRVLTAETGSGEGDPGVVVALADGAPAVATGRGVLVLRDVQPEGRNVMTGAEYVRGHGLKPGDRLGPPPA